MAHFTQGMHQHIMSEDTGSSVTDHQMGVDEAYLGDQAEAVEKVQDFVPETKSGVEPVPPHRPKGGGSVGEAAGVQVEAYQGGEEGGVEVGIGRRDLGGGCRGMAPRRGRGGGGKV